MVKSAVLVVKKFIEPETLDLKIDDVV